MYNGLSKEEIEYCFQQLCAEAGRQGIIGFSPVEAVQLLPEQALHLQQKLTALGHVEDIAAISLGLFYHEQEILAVPAAWKSKSTADDRWNDYARAYQTLNRLLNHFTAVLTAQFGGVAEQATMEGWAEKVKHVTDYFPHCVSHRAFAEGAGLGWRGRHGLIVTPQAGPALRFATVFLPGRVPSSRKGFAGCGDCQACFETCPMLRKGGEYREACRRRVNTLGLEAEVCGICVRVCWEHVRTQRHREQGHG